MRITLTILVLFAVVGCTEVNTDDPEEAYYYWANDVLEEGWTVLNGQYWRSPHWSLEFQVFLKLKAPEGWWQELPKDQSLDIDTTSWYVPDDAPNWFDPPPHCVKYGYHGLNDDHLYLVDSLRGETYIYESQY